WVKALPDRPPACPSQQRHRIPVEHHPHRTPAPPGVGSPPRRVTHQAPHPPPVRRAEHQVPAPTLLDPRQRRGRGTHDLGRRLLGLHQPPEPACHVGRATRHL